MHARSSSQWIQFSLHIVEGLLVYTQSSLSLFLFLLKIVYHSYTHIHIYTGCFMYVLQACHFFFFLWLVEKG